MTPRSIAMNNDEHEPSCDHQHGEGANRLASTRATEAAVAAYRGPFDPLIEGITGMVVRAHEGAP